MVTQIKDERVPVYNNLLQLSIPIKYMVLIWLQFENQPLRVYGESQSPTIFFLFLSLSQLGL